MIKIRLTFLGLVLLAHPLPAQTNSPPLPALEVVMQRVLARAAKEDDNDREFNRQYHYSRVRVTDFRNASGELKSHEEKNTEEGVRTNSSPVVAPAAAPAPVEKDAPVSETHSHIHGKALRVKDYSLTNLVSRFEFTLVGRETVNGRPALVLDFKPAAKSLPVISYKDHFINKAAGRLWVDEADYAIARGNIYLTQQVNVLGGLVGAIWKFTYSFDRERTPEGLWFSRQVDWHLEGREVVFHRIVDYHEQKLDAQKVR
jgi:hypothetical protein